MSFYFVLALKQSKKNYCNWINIGEVDDVLKFDSTEKQMNDIESIR